MKKIVIILLAGLMLFSCSKNENVKAGKANEPQVYKLSSKPSKGKIETALDVVLSLKGNLGTESDSTRFTNPVNLDMDKDGNIYIFDKTDMKIRKYDSEGKFITSFGKKGNGPGEYLMAAMGLMVAGDRVMVSDFMTQSVVVFDLNGKFLERINSPGAVPAMVESIGNNKYFALKSGAAQENGKLYFIGKLAVLNEKFEEDTVVWEMKKEFNPTEAMKLGQEQPLFSLSKDQVFICHKSEDKWLIEAYDFKGNKIASYKRPWRKLSYSAEEISRIDDKILGEMKKRVGEDSGLDLDMYKFKEKYKKSLNNIIVEANGDIWAFTSKEEFDDNKFEVDLIRNHEFVNEVEFTNLGAEKNRFLTWIDGKIYIQDTEENVINVYKVEL